MENGYSVFEQVDGISDVNYTCSYDLTIHKWVIGETNNTKIVSGTTDSLCPSFNDTAFAWFYENDVYEEWVCEFLIASTNISIFTGT